MKYVPYRRKTEVDGSPVQWYGPIARENKWGFHYYTVPHYLTPNIINCIIPKETSDKIDIITQPIDMTDFLAMQAVVNNNLFNLVQSNVKTMANEKKLPKKQNLPIPEGYREKLAEIKEEYRKRMKAAGGQMILQYNAKTGLLGDNWLRAIQCIPNEVTGNVDYQNYHKVTWLGYFFVDIPRNLMVSLYCKLNNLWFRKKIEAELKEAKRLCDEQQREFERHFNRTEDNASEGNSEIQEKDRSHNQVT